MDDTYKIVDFTKAGNYQNKIAYKGAITTFGIEVIDPDVASHSGDGVRPNSAGHQIIAEAIYDAICNEN